MSTTQLVDNNENSDAELSLGQPSAVVPAVFAIPPNTGLLVIRVQPLA